MIKIAALGKIRDPHIKAVFEEYVKRLKTSIARVEIETVKDGKRLLKRLKKEDLVVVLDREGSCLSSVELAGFIREHMLTRDILFIIGGPEGLDEDLLKRADHRLSLSKMTFTSQMTCLILIEQLYRAFTIIKGGSYHR
ncbi:MAG: 23S rRNA (pseudouridine(1915)-N(3))-methyltransferase RlmH [Methanobacteriota archaeon]|nr:MAG: 23S rRNA (pseudouridine(1915)-N(3))-methyltransferase RlmH [Euryarchaeota archaeon]